MLITDEQLHQMIPGATDKSIKKFISPMNETLKRYNINTPPRIAAFIAQIAHESGNLYYVEEIASGSNYEFRDDLGNLHFEALQIAHENKTTTGKFYKGRGLIQLTGYYNYKKFGELLKLDLIHNPELLCEPINATLISGCYWDINNCNSFADVGLFGKITKIINGGYNGSADRLANYARCKKVLEC